ncbi:ion transporter [Pontibacter ramchanderi]|uniref:Voltage-gated potassium channel n=1 Tax=Pontibacter ramchanderi TaxID=1179743 RepID=A0A2N3V1L5_9BACT|nr:ion transporter [Pontibacter ramchanderi]PKV75473.1 voltage-gated potassium channel [Pontibacter ramchanderi]
MPNQKRDSLKRRLYSIIFEAETPAGRAFDVVLLILIMASVVVVSLESVVSFRRSYLHVFQALEWTFTILFTIEYLLRIYSSAKPIRYIFSFFGIIDLLAIIPTYLSLFVLGSQYLLVIRVFRLLRIARVFRLTRFVNEGQVLSKALRASLTKITVFLGVVLMMVIVVGALMYVIEGRQSGYTSIPISVYWAIVTVTTVGFGDITPVTPIGQFLASCLMITGYGIIAVPTGIVSVELANAERMDTNTRVCPNCHKEGHPKSANFCDNCGYKLHSDLEPVGNSANL